MPAPRALALLSGGLDSMLAARVVQQHGVVVEAINFFTGFCVEGHTRALRRDTGGPPRGHDALWVADQLGIRLHFEDVSEDYKPVVLKPRFGYGTHMNPCLDCKIFMATRAWSFAREHGFDFLITGEVLGQRPKSQRPEALPLIARSANAEDRLLRPLSALHLAPTLPEREGWVERERLYAFHGRNRKPQLALARELGIVEHAQPAGGCCFLTDAAYSRKFEDLLDSRTPPGARDPDGARRSDPVEMHHGNAAAAPAHPSREPPDAAAPGSELGSDIDSGPGSALDYDLDYDLDEIILLKVGRHLRPEPGFKLIIGREASENRYLSGYRHRYATLEATSHQGPIALIDGHCDEAGLALAAGIVARYGQGRSAEQVTLRLTNPASDPRSLTVTPRPAHEIPPEWML